MIKIQPFRFVVFVLLGAAALTGALALFAACTAHAKVVMDGTPPTVAVVPAVAADPGLPIAAWIALALSSLVALERIVRGLAQLSGVIAKRTPNTIDDAVHDKLDKLADGLDELVAVVRGVQPTSSPAPTVVVNNATEPRDPQAGRVGAVVLAALTAIGAGGLLGMGVLALDGCGSARQRGAAAAKAFLECEAPHVDAHMLADAKLLAVAAAEKWIGGDGHIDAAGLKADAKPLKTDLLRCAMDAAIAMLTAPAAAAKPDAPMAAGLTVDAEQVRGAWAEVRGELGWPQVKAVP